MPRLATSDVEGPEIHGVQDAVAVPVCTDVGCETGVGDPFNGHPVNGQTCDSPKGILFHFHVIVSLRTPKQTPRATNTKGSLDVGLSVVISASNKP